VQTNHTGFPSSQKCLNYDALLEPSVVSYHKQNFSMQIWNNQDILVKKILNSVFTDQYFEWQQDDLTLYSEAYIQRSLKNQGIMLQCYNLDKFPTSTKNLIEIFE